MFTGLIEDVGTIKGLQRTSIQCQLIIQTSLPLESINLGDSVAVNGCCLTVVSLGRNEFTADVSPETLDRTGLGEHGSGARVNLERALCLGDRLGGHIVTGHVDCRALLLNRKTDGNAEVLEFQVENEHLRYLVAKGSVAIDGISLTVNAVSASSFTVSIIPHTLSRTTLESLSPGSSVNIETDVIGKYVERLLGPRDAGGQKSSVSLEFLAKHGFV